MFSLNLNGIFVLTMSKKSHFLIWDSPPQTAFSAVPLTSQQPTGKIHAVACLLRHLQNVNKLK